MSNNPLLHFAAAKQLVLKEAELVNYQQYEIVKLFDANNRIAAKTISSPMNVPDFDNSAMDGYAIRLADLENTNSLPVAGIIYAGDNGNKIDWPKNSCLRIMTGAPVPHDADAVIMQEDITKDNQNIVFNSAIKTGQNIRRIGENVKKGENLIAAGEKLTITKLATLATLGLSDVCVYKPLKVAIFSTGNELVPIGAPLTSSGMIYDSNRFAIHLMLKELGCEVIDLGIIKDDPASISSTLKQAANQADIVITSGGVSVGDADFTKKTLEEIGSVNFWKIAMKPGKPFAFGKIGNALFCGLPGNPVSTLVTFYQLVRPLIATIYGNKNQLENDAFAVKTVSNLKKSIGRVDFQRGHLFVTEGGTLAVESTGDQGSHITTSFHQANCFIVLEKNRANVLAGEWVNVQFFEPVFL